MIIFYNKFLQWQSNNQRVEMFPIDNTGQEKNNSLANGPAVLNSYVRVSGLRNINKYAKSGNIRPINVEPVVVSSKEKTNPTGNKKDN